MAVWNRENFLNANPWQPSGGGARPGAPINTALAQALAGIVKPEIGSSFQAPALRINPLQARNDPHPEQRGPMGAAMTPLGQPGGGARDQGGAAKAAGLQKLGQGIEGALGDIAAKRAQAAKYAESINQLPGKPPSFMTPPKPAGNTAGNISGDASDTNAPANPSFPPIGAASDTPIFAQPGTGTGPVGSSVGPAGSLPTFAQGAPGGGGGAGPSPSYLPTLAKIENPSGDPYETSKSGATGKYQNAGQLQYSAKGPWPPTN